MSGHAYHCAETDRALKGLSISQEKKRGATGVPSRGGCYSTNERERDDERQKRISFELCLFHSPVPSGVHAKAVSVMCPFLSNNQLVSTGPESEVGLSKVGGF